MKKRNQFYEVTDKGTSLLGFSVQHYPQCLIIFLGTGLSVPLTGLSRLSPSRVSTRVALHEIFNSNHKSMQLLWWLYRQGSWAIMFPEEPQGTTQAGASGRSHTPHVSILSMWRGDFFSQIQGQGYRTVFIVFVLLMADLDSIPNSHFVPQSIEPGLTPKHCWVYSSPKIK